MQSLPLHISSSFSVPLKEDIVDIEKPGEICSLTFDLDEFLGFLYIYQSFL